MNGSTMNSTDPATTTAAAAAAVRWRLILGEGDATLDDRQSGMDRALGALYDAPDTGDGRRGAGLGASSPKVHAWLGDIRTYFPDTVVQVLQRDAIDRLNLRELLLEPEILSTLEPDVHLVATLAELSSVIPETSKETARQVVRSVVEEVEKRVRTKTETAVRGALDRSARTHRPRPADIDWNRTIAANLKNYLPDLNTVVPEKLVGYARAGTGVQKEIVLAVDQSGSMATSVVYSSIFGAVLGSIRALKTSMIVFDTTVVDLTEKLADPVDVIFGTQLGGGTDINAAVAYSQELITSPTDSVFVLISDLYEGGVRSELLARMRTMVDAGVTVLVLLALSDDGAPSYDRDLAAELSGLGVTAFACTPDIFPDLLAAAIDGGGDLSRFAGQE